MEQIEGAEALYVLRLSERIFGRIDYAELTSPAMDQRVRRRYRKEIAELTGLGFEYLCSEGQSFPLSRFLRVFPALMSFGIWLNGVPVWIKNGFIVFGYAILCSKRKPSFVELDASHAKFISAFQDGSLLVSGNYEFPMPSTGKIERQFKAAALAETWEAHRTRLGELERTGRRVDPRGDYAVYAKASAVDRSPRQD